MKGQRLKDLREQIGFTQEELAQHCGITSKQLRRYEMGESEATASVIVQLAKTLRVSADYLLGLVDDKSDKYGGDELTGIEIQLLATLQQANFQASVKAMQLIAELLTKYGEEKDRGQR